MFKLSFETFRIANRTRSKRFFEPATVDNWSPADTLVGMIGELGEACNVMKKLKRAQLGMVNKNKEGRQIDTLTDEVRYKLMEEFAGAMLYFDQLAEHFGIDWQEAIEYTYNSKSEELGFPERIFAGRFCVVESDKGIAVEYLVVHPNTVDQVHESKYERNVERPDKMQTQEDEFDMFVTLMRAYNNLPAIVDDDYPECRHRYEGALQQFIKALKANSRIGPEIEQARDRDLAIIYAPKERSEIDPPEGYHRLMTITFDAMTFKPTTVVKLIRKALRNRFKDYRFKTEAIG